MKITFALNKSIYDCQIEIADTFGTLYPLLYANAGGEPAYLTVDIRSTNFDITLTPLIPDSEKGFDDGESYRLADGVAQKAAQSAVAALRKCVLQVSCSYHMDNVQDGEQIELCLQPYMCGPYDKYDILDLTPVVYMYFEVYRFCDRLQPTNAFALNRKEFLKSAKAMSSLALLADGLWGVLTLPLHIWRAKHLSKNQTVYKTITKFHHMSDEQRQRIAEKSATL